MMAKRLIPFFTVLMLIAASAQAELRVITAKEVKALLDRGEIFLLNPLSEIEFNQAHIPGSVNIPLHRLRDTDRLPEDKSVFIVTYCLGPK